MFCYTSGSVVTFLLNFFFSYLLWLKVTVMAIWTFPFQHYANSWVIVLILLDTSILRHATGHQLNMLRGTVWQWSSLSLRAPRPWFTVKVSAVAGVLSNPSRPAPMITKRMCQEKAVIVFRLRTSILLCHTVSLFKCLNCQHYLERCEKCNWRRTLLVGFI